MQQTKYKHYVRKVSVGNVDLEADSLEEQKCIIVAIYPSTDKGLYVNILYKKPV